MYKEAGGVLNCLFEFEILVALGRLILKYYSRKNVFLLNLQRQVIVVYHEKNEGLDFLDKLAASKSREIAVSPRFEKLEKVQKL